MLKSDGLDAEQQIRIQLFPHSDNRHLFSGFRFPTIDKIIKPNSLLKIGRKVDKMDLQLPKDHYNHIDVITFKSKVVSRAHAEIAISTDGVVSLRDVGSSSGSFLNRLRLSASGKCSQFQNLKSGDIITLGVDYQGRQEEVYKAVMMRIFITSRTAQQAPPKKSPQKLKKALLALLAAMNSTTASKTEHASCTECCICLSSLSPYQALFLAPCSHCFHYKCIVPLLQSEILFQCPLCRQVANLDNTEFMEDEDDLIETEDEEESASDKDLKQKPLPLLTDNMDVDLSLSRTKTKTNNKKKDEDIVIVDSPIDESLLLQPPPPPSTTKIKIPKNIQIPLPNVVVNIHNEFNNSPSTPISHSMRSSSSNNNNGNLENEDEEDEDELMGAGMARDNGMAGLRSRLVELNREFPGTFGNREIERILSTAAAAGGEMAD